MSMSDTQMQFWKPSETAQPLTYNYEFLLQLEATLLNTTTGPRQFQSLEGSLESFVSPVVQGSGYSSHFPSLKAELCVFIYSNIKLVLLSRGKNVHSLGGNV